MYIKVESAEGDAAEIRSFQYSWGIRAELEVKKSDLLRMICQLYNCKVILQLHRISIINPKMEILVIQVGIQLP